MSQPRVRGLVALALGVLSCTGLAYAQPPASYGPDVIVGDLPGIANNAASGLYDSFAVGTTSCNKGGAPLNWFTGGTDNRHPVIGQNLFRLRSGKFEQIGQGWLKHGFTALQGNICQGQFGYGCTATSGITLGIGCSDPYSAGLNNVVGNGGPKWQVNASTGLFPYPFPSAGSAPVRVRLTDLGTAGDRYFVEGQYVGGDDAQANGGANKNNNASWEEVTYNGTDFTITGSTTRELPAIYAWQTIDPTVTITTFDVPNDGRFILACKVTGTGPYTYEYALHNLNSHRCGGSFVVPMPGTQGALTGVGFHDAECVGEPNQLVDPNNPASDDWAVAGTGAGSTSVSWAGPAYSGTPPTYTLSTSPPTPYLLAATGGFVAGTGNDHTANVIRWGNLFNFRFTCNAAPAPGTILVGLWRPGTGTSIAMSIPTPGGATNGTVTASCCTGTTCSVATQTACGTGVWGLPGSTCTPNPCTTGSCCVTAGTCTVTTSASCTGGAAWTSGGVCSPNPCPQPATGSCCVPSSGACTLTTQANCSTGSNWTTGGTCNPNTCPVASGACCVATVCSPTTQPACTGSFLGANTTCATSTCPSGNDACIAAIPLCAGTGVASTTVSATFSAGDYNVAATCGNAGTSPDVWYSYVPATTGTIVVDTCIANYDTVISANTGTCGSLVEAACNDDNAGGVCGANQNLSSRISFTGTAGVRYLLRVAGYQGATGTFTILVTGGGGTGCNGSGSCCIGTSCTITASSTACSGSYTAGRVCNPNPCNPTGSCCVGTACSSVTQTSCATSGGVFTAAGTCTTTTCNPNGACCTSGNCTAVQQTGCINGVFTAGGACTPNPCAPLSDNCANRQGVPVGSTPFDTTNATTDGPTHALCAGSGDSGIGKDVWFNFPCTFDGTIDVDTCGSTFDTKLAVYDGSGCTNYDARLLACDDDAACASGTLQSQILALPVVCGHSYTIRVGGYTTGTTTAAGAGTMTITAHPNALGTCCATDGSCAQSQQGCCVGTWTTAGTCSPNTCPQPTGACCNNGVCSIQTHLVCGGANYQGDNSVCSPNPCPQTTGACCVGTACSITTSTACTGSFKGAGTVCSAPGNPITCCKANFNQVNGINVQDIFDFLAAWFAQSPTANFNNDNFLNVQDIFDFLSAWFAGC